MTSDLRLRLLMTVATSIGLQAVPSPGVAQSAVLAPAGTGVSVALQGHASTVATDLTGSTTRGRSLWPRAEVALAATPRLGVLAAFGTQTVTVDGSRFDIDRLDLGLRYTGWVGRRVRPFGEVGMSRQAFMFGTRTVIRTVNLGPWGAVGAAWRPSGRVGFEGALTAGTVTFDQFTADGVAQALQPVMTRQVGVRAGLRIWLSSR